MMKIKKFRVNIFELSFRIEKILIKIDGVYFFRFYT